MKHGHWLSFQETPDVIIESPSIEIPEELLFHCKRHGYILGARYCYFCRKLRK